MNFTFRAMLPVLLAGAPALAQLIPPDSLPPPVSPALLPRPAYDPHPPPPPPGPPEIQVAPANEQAQPPILPPDSGLEVTPGHFVAGCMQLPLYRDRGPYIQAPPWPGGIIPFEYDGNVTQANRDLFDAAMAEVESYCDVDYVPRELYHASWLHIQNSTVNNAPVGFGPGQRIVNINAWTTHYTMVHELFHVLGVYHEQSRTDRDSYVVINWSNICQTCCPDNSGNPGPCDFNFQREDQSGTFGLYNFDSFMHYPRNAFANGGTDTITVLSAYAAIWQNRIGQRTHWTFGDRSTAMWLYQPGWAKVADDSAGGNGSGSWLSPYNNFPDAYNAAPLGGDVILRPGYYQGLGLRNRAMRIHAPDGGVRIGQ